VNSRRELDPARARPARRAQRIAIQLEGRDAAGKGCVINRFTLATDIQVYFCDPHHPWQRGTNENTNGLLRQYFPKGVSLADVSQAELDAVARQLNERSRKTLGYETPAERYRQTVASIG
jgi:IS30 family transposase